MTTLKIATPVRPERSAIGLPTMQSLKIPLVRSTFTNKNLKSKGKYISVGASSRGFV